MLNFISLVSDTTAVSANSGGRLDPVVVAIILVVVLIICATLVISSLLKSKNNETVACEPTTDTDAASTPVNDAASTASAVASTPAPVKAVPTPVNDAASTASAVDSTPAPVEAVPTPVNDAASTASAVDSTPAPVEAVPAPVNNAASTDSESVKLSIPQGSSIKRAGKTIGKFIVYDDNKMVIRTNRGSYTALNDADGIELAGYKVTKLGDKDLLTAVSDTDGIFLLDTSWNIVQKLR